MVAGNQNLSQGRISAYLSGVFGDINSTEAIFDTVKRLQPERLSDQFCFLTQKAVAALSFKGVECYKITAECI